MAKRRTKRNTILYLHDELTAPGHPPFSQKLVFRLLLLLGLLDLGQPTDRVHALSIVWTSLGRRTKETQCSKMNTECIH